MRIDRRGLRVLRGKLKNFGWTVKQLEACCLANNGCDSCLDIGECVTSYDRRCGEWTITLPPPSIFIQREKILDNKR